MALAQGDIEVRFDRMAHDLAVETEVRAWLTKLALPIGAAGVRGGVITIEARPRRSQTALVKHNVQIALDCSRGAIDIGGDWQMERPQEDVYVAVRDAFRQLRRRLA